MYLQFSFLHFCLGPGGAIYRIASLVVVSKLLRHKARLKGIWPSLLIGMPKLSEPFGLYTFDLNKLMYLVLLSYHTESLQISFDCYVSLMPKRRLAILRMSRTIHPILVMGRLFGSVQRKAQPIAFGKRSRRPKINFFVF